MSREEASPARRGDQTSTQATKNPAEINMERNWNNLSNNEEDTLAEQEETNTETELTVGGLTEKLFVAIATQMGRIVAETHGDTLQLPAASEISTLLKGIGGLSEEHKQKFSDTCIQGAAWYNRALGIMKDEADKKTTCFYKREKG